MFNPVWFQYHKSQPKKKTSHIINTTTLQSDNAIVFIIQSTHILHPMDHKYILHSIPTFFLTKKKSPYVISESVYIFIYINWHFPHLEGDMSDRKLISVGRNELRFMCLSNIDMTQFWCTISFDIIHNTTDWVCVKSITVGVNVVIGRCDLRYWSHTGLNMYGCDCVCRIRTGWIRTPSEIDPYINVIPNSHIAQSVPDVPMNINTNSFQIPSNIPVKNQFVPHQIHLWFNNTDHTTQFIIPRITRSQNNNNQWQIIPLIWSD